MRMLFAWFPTLLCALLIGVLITVTTRMYPRIHPGIYSIDGGAPLPFQLPLTTPSQGKMLTIDFDLTTPMGYAPSLLMSADDCVVSLHVNGVDARTDDRAQGYCSSTLMPLRISSLLDQNTNHFTVVLEDHGGLATFDLRMSVSDPLFVGSWILGIALVLAYLYLSKRLLGWEHADLGVAVIVLFGIALRALYVFVTPVGLRSHEWDKHTEYIQSMAENFSVPPAAGGWEFHQPPLYYALTSLWMRIGTLAGRGPEVLLRDLQLFSLFVSIVTLSVGVAIGSLLFHEPKKRTGRLLFTLFIATFPSIVFFSSRISNDILAQLFSVLFLFFLLRWWRWRGTKDFLGLSLTIALALLTKTSALLLLAIALLSFALARGLPVLKKVRLSALTILLCLLIAGWLPVLRYGIETDTTRSRVLGNEGMHPLVALTNTPSAFLTANPLEILRHPYIDPNSDESRRQYFPEYFFRSAFTGEFSFPESFRVLSFLILLFGMISLPLIALGCFADIREDYQKSLPLLITLSLGCIAVLGYRILFPYAPNQDFRFVTFLVIPCSYFAMAGARFLPGPLKRYGMSILTALAILCGLFFLKLYFGA